MRRVRAAPLAREGVSEAPEDDPKAPTAVAPEGWGSTVGEIVDAGEDPATPI